MTTDFHNEQVDPILRAVVQQKVKNIVGRHGITVLELEDIEQHVFYILLDRVAIDAHSSPRGKLLETLIDRVLANYLRDRRAQKRDPRRSLYLSLVVDVDEYGCPITLAESISDTQRGARLGLRKRSDQERVDKRLDLQWSLSKLPVPLADLCERLKHSTPMQIARDLDIPPSTIYDRIRQIRERFQEDGLGDYL